MKKQLFILLSLIALLVTAQVPQRFNKVIVTGDITSPKFIKTGSNADSVLLGNGSARAISTVKTDTVSLSNRINAKATGNGTANGTNTGDETLTSIKTKLGAATSVSDGYLKYQDYVKFDGKLSSEVDGSVTNELQTISTTGAAGNITLSNSGGTLNLNVNDADASTTNEIQDLSLSGNTLSLSSDATTVDVSQATAVLANTAKVSNATHTGDVTGSTALTLATVNSNIGTYNNVTINAKGLATAGSNVSYEPSFSKNTAFNKNFGTTTGTVLEGRTFGTAAGSAVGDFQPVENQRLSTSNSPSFNTITSTVATGTAPLTVNSTTMVGNLKSQYLGSTVIVADANLQKIAGSYYYNTGSTNVPFIGRLLHQGYDEIGYNGQIMTSETGNRMAFRTQVDTTWNPWNEVYHSGNLTSTLTTNYLPKWNGSSMVNSLISDNGTSVNISGSLTSTSFIKSGGTASQFLKANGSVDSNTYLTSLISSGNSGFKNDIYYSNLPNPIWSFGNAIPFGLSYYQGSALSVGDAIGFHFGDIANPTFYVSANGSTHASSFYGSGSNLTGVQLPITLTTNGTSGAATFSGGVLNVPNYNSIAVGDSYTCIERNNYGVTIGLAKAYFTKVGNITSIAINADCTTTATGWCSIQLPTPPVSSPNWSATCNAFITGASPAVLQACLQVESPNYVTIAFYSTAAGVPVKITVTGMAK